jgi:signal recognition particle GTPase
MLGGYSKFKDFFNPSDEKPNENNFDADIRSTIYWNPFILTNKKSPRIRIQFFNNDITKKFLLVLEGVNGDGKMTRVVKLIDSKSQD